MDFMYGFSFGEGFNQPVDGVVSGGSEEHGWNEDHELLDSKHELETDFVCNEQDQMIEGVDERSEEFCLERTLSDGGSDEGEVLEGDTHEVVGEFSLQNPLVQKLLDLFLLDFLHFFL